MDNPKTYTCAVCGLIFRSKWSDEDAAAETMRLFGVDPMQTDQEMAILCETCFRARLKGLRN